MTILAGVYSRHADNPIPEPLRAEVQRAISRHPGETPDTFSDDRCLLVKADVGAYGAAARRVDSAAATFMVGEPLLADPDLRRRPRSADLDELHSALVHDDDSPLSRVRGVFALAHYRIDTGTLVLVTDKLGIRPMYYWLGERYVIFATAMRILEGIAEVPKCMNLRGVTELSAFGFPLADRTAYDRVSLLMSGELAQFSSGNVVRRRYWNWDVIQPSARPVSELAKRSYDRFGDAISLRLGNDRKAAAFLSGGLDSRAIVCALRERGVELRTFNFALPGTQDQVFGAAFGKRVGVAHVEAPMKPGHPAWSMMMAQALAAHPAPSGARSERPQVVWAGDGGSVALGHVYLDAKMVGLARADNSAELVELLNGKWGAEVPRRLMRSSVTESQSHTTRRGLLDEFKRIETSDRGRALHLLLMYNDQRRHLAEHFEGIDIHRLEFELPFFDSDFVASVLEVPIDICLGHGFYMQWLRHFPEVIVSVPWQAYPGHVPCPLPVPPELGYQWEHNQSRGIRDAQKRNLIEQANTILRMPHFPHELMNRSFLRLATLLYQWKVRDLAYVIRTAVTYYHYWSRSGGKVAPPPGDA